MVRHELGFGSVSSTPHSANTRSRALSADATFSKQLRPSILGSCHRPDTLTDESGTFSIPSDWG